jgi:hypothetical protein
MAPLLLTLAFLAVDVTPPTPDVEYKQPQLASQGRNVALVFGSGNAVMFSGSADHGNTFSAPVVVARVASLSLGNHRGPRVVFAADALVAIAGVGHELASWRSTDGGKSWSAGPRIAASAGEGFVGLGSDGAKRLWAAWLAPQDGHVTLFGAHSEDAGVNWSAPLVVYRSADGNVCECCHPSVAFAANGDVLVMFRNSLGGARDFYLARSGDDGKTFQTAKVGEGTWPLKACPMDGGGMVVADGSVVTAWRRELDIFVARPGSAEEKIGEGRNPAVAAGRDGAYVIWSTADGLMARTPGRKEAYSVSKGGGFPSISGGMQVIAAWEDGGRIRTARLD